MRLGPWMAALSLASQVSGAAPNAAPDPQSEFVFTRIRYGSSLQAYAYFRGGDTWRHDYPRADQNLSRILSELTTLDVSTATTDVITLDDPALFRRPIIYISEPGFWMPSQGHVEQLRAYLHKGGFLIFDDFELEQWENVELQMRRVLPDHHFVELDVSHPVFQTFFPLKTNQFPHPLVDVWPTYYGIFEDDDPSRRLMVIANYNNDIAEYWEWSDQGWFPIDITNDAYKLGVNYVIYGMTH